MNFWLFLALFIINCITLILCIYLCCTYLYRNNGSDDDENNNDDDIVIELNSIKNDSDV